MRSKSKRIAGSLFFTHFSQEFWFVLCLLSISHLTVRREQDFLDENNTKDAKDAIGDSLFAVLSDICFSLTAPRTGVDLRCTVSLDQEWFLSFGLPICATSRRITSCVMARLHIKVTSASSGILRC